MIQRADIITNTSSHGRNKAHYVHNDTGAREQVPLSGCPNGLTLKMFILACVAAISLSSCSAMTKNHGMIHADTLSVQPEIERFPIVEVRITPVDTVLNYGDKILLDIRLENKGKEVQKLLFDRPAISTGGPWSMFGRVIDVRSNKSVVKMGDKSGLSSQLFSENQLKDKYYHLKPGQSVEKRYGLTDIVTLDSPLDSLPRGTYAVQLVYEVNQSNVVIIKIQ